MHDGRMHEPVTLELAREIRQWDLDRLRGDWLPKAGQEKQDDGNPDPHPAPRCEAGAARAIMRTDWILCRGWTRSTGGGRVERLQPLVRAGCIGARGQRAHVHEDGAPTRFMLRTGGQNGAHPNPSTLGRGSQSQVGTRPRNSNSITPTRNSPHVIPGFFGRNQCWRVEGCCDRLPTRMVGFAC